MSSGGSGGRPVVVTVGEGLLRLTPPDASPLPGATSLRVHVGGAEANVAAGLSTLGVPARWFSRVALGPTGEALLRPLAALGVDVGSVLRAPGRTGLYFVEDGAGVRPTRVTYDRAGSTFAGLAPEHLTDPVLDRIFERAGWLHLTGIDLAVADAPLAALERLWSAARRRAVRRSFDVNVRTTLPEADRLGQRAAAYLGSADLVFVAERDVHALALPHARSGASEANPDALLERLATAGPDATWVLTRGVHGAAARAPDGAFAARPSLPASGPGRIGRGDAFAAGFLSVWSDRSEIDPGPDDRLARALAYGVAAASFKASSPGDLPDLDPVHVASLADGAAATLER